MMLKIVNTKKETILILRFCPLAIFTNINSLHVKDLLTFAILAFKSCN